MLCENDTELGVDTVVSSFKSLTLLQQRDKLGDVTEFLVVLDDVL